MRHRAPRLPAVVAVLLLALGAVCTAAGVASVTSSASDLTEATPRRAHARQEAFTPRPSARSPAQAAAHGSGPHLHLLAALAASGSAALLLLGWFVAARARHLLPRLVTAPLGARAPPALA